MGYFDPERQTSPVSVWPCVYNLEVLYSLRKINLESAVCHGLSDTDHSNVIMSRTKQAFGAVLVIILAFLYNHMHPSRLMAERLPNGNLRYKAMFWAPDWKEEHSYERIHSSKTLGKSCEKPFKKKTLFDSKNPNESVGLLAKNWLQQIQKTWNSFTGCSWLTNI